MYFLVFLCFHAAWSASNKKDKLDIANSINTYKIALLDSQPISTSHDGLDLWAQELEIDFSGETCENYSSHSIAAYLLVSCNFKFEVPPYTDVIGVEPAHENKKSIYDTRHMKQYTWLYSSPFQRIVHAYSSSNQIEVTIKKKMRNPEKSTMYL